jgi:hypothetical protein
VKNHLGTGLSGRKVQAPGVEEGTARLKMPPERLVAYAPLLGAAIEVVPHDEVARLEAVDAELMRTACLGMEFEQAHMWMTCQGNEPALGRLSVRIRAHPAAVRPVWPQSPLPEAFPGFGLAPDERQIDLFHPAFRESPHYGGMGLTVPRQKDKARCSHIQAVNEVRSSIVGPE